MYGPFEFEKSLRVEDVFSFACSSDFFHVFAVFMRLYEIDWILIVLASKKIAMEELANVANLAESVVA